MPLDGPGPRLSRLAYTVLDPDHRWFPADQELLASPYEKLLPPLVARIRKEVPTWRDSGYLGVSDVSKSLLR